MLPVASALRARREVVCLRGAVPRLPITILITNISYGRMDPSGATISGDAPPSEIEKRKRHVEIKDRGIELAFDPTIARLIDARVSEHI